MTPTLREQSSRRLHGATGRLPDGTATSVRGLSWIPGPDEPTPATVLPLSPRGTGQDDPLDVCCTALVDQDGSNGIKLASGRADIVIDEDAFAAHPPRIRDRERITQLCCECSFRIRPVARGLGGFAHLDDQTWVGDVKGPLVKDVFLLGYLKDPLRVPECRAVVAKERGVRKREAITNA